jgi:hypothetical protein
VPELGNRVRVGCECDVHVCVPRAFETVTTSTPAASKLLAKEWRRS